MVEGQSPPAFPLVSDLRGLLEYALERLDAQVGPVTIELRAVDGRLERIYRHEGPIPATALAVRFGRESESGPG